MTEREVLQANHDRLLHELREKSAACVAAYERGGDTDPEYIELQPVVVKLSEDHEAARLSLLELP